MKLHCERLRKHPGGNICGYHIGDDDRDLELIAMIRVARDLERAFPPPRIAHRCPRCGWWHVYEPAEIWQRRGKRTGRLA